MSKLKKRANHNERTSYRNLSIIVLTNFVMNKLQDDPIFTCTLPLVDIVRRPLRVHNTLAPQV